MTLRVPARAKVNLHLRVLFPRPDGYHELRTVYQTVDLADEIVLEPAPDGELSFHCGQPEIPAGEDNLCWRAARLLLEETGTRRGARITLVKRIPMQAGLGGGSADAAAVLAGLNRLWDLARPLEDLLLWAGRLGSDVPFFLLGGTALGVGRGEELVPLPDAPPRHVLLVCPPVAVSTAWAYGRLNFLLTTKGFANKIPPLHRVLADGRLEAFRGVNDFETAVFPEFPLLLQIKNQIADCGAEGTMMSGSGSSIYGLFESAAACKEAERNLCRQSVPGRIVCTRFVGRDEYRRHLLSTWD
jgi:4-diphosphocytidyl-2-C-methyl-D-erythritol kinase